MGQITQFVNFNSYNIAKITWDHRYSVSNFIIGDLYKIKSCNPICMHNLIIDDKKSKESTVIISTFLPLTINDVILFCGIKNNYLQWLYKDKFFITDNSFVREVIPTV